MALLDTIHLLYDYHYWRSARVLKACEALTPSQWDQSLEPSWGSVHSLLAHMVAAEKIWLGRWKGVSARSLMPAEAVPALADVGLAWKDLEKEMRTFIDGCDESRLAANVTYTNTKGRTFSFPLWELMLHVVDHATHHRGELVAMLTMLKIPHPEDGLNTYLVSRTQA